MTREKRKSQARFSPLDKREKSGKTRSMKRKRVRRAHKPSSHYLVVVRGWMFLVAFAMMLGLGAMVGNFVNEQMNQSTPQVAGASVEK